MAAQCLSVDDQSAASTQRSGPISGKYTEKWPNQLQVYREVDQSAASTQKSGPISDKYTQHD